MTTKASALMRKYYSDILKTQFYRHLIETRAMLGLTQEQMAETLVMDVRSFMYLDHGKHSCSALTLSLYLIYFCPDVNAFLQDLKAEFEKEGDIIA